MLTSEQAATKLKDQQLSASEKLAASTESLKDTLASIVAGPLGMMLDKVTSLFNLIAKSDIAKAVLGTAGGIAAAIAAVSTAVLVGKGIINSSKNRPTGNGGDPIHTVVDGGGGGTGGSVSGTGGGGKGLSGNFKDLFKGGRAGKVARGRTMRGLKGLGKGLGKGLVKGIPYAGALLGAGLEFADGGLTWESAGRAAASGIGSFAGGALGSLVAPGVGTAAGAIGGSMAGDYLGDLIFGEREELAKGGIVNKPTRALVGEAGPEAVIPLDKLMAEFREMRAVLTQIANKEGIVYLDGAKVGSAMGMRAYKTQ
jgi:hypothetical protein